MSYQDDLLHQLDYQYRMKELEKEQAQKEIAMQKKAEACYQQRVQAGLSRSLPDKIHPRRIPRPAI